MNSKKRICVLFHYYEKNENYMENLSHFLKFGIVDDVDYYFIVVDGVCSLPLSSFLNVNVINVPNGNYDYGGFSKALTSVVPWNKYDYVFFINSSVRGPYIPPHLYPQCRFWFDCFLEKFEHNVGVVGVSINVLPRGSKHFKKYEQHFGQSDLPLSHVQTPIYCLSNESLTCLVNKGFFDPDVSWGRDEVISKYEIRMSRLLIKNGYNIKCLIPEHNVIDYRRKDLESKVDQTGDVFGNATYFGRTIHPYEAMFIKSERNLWPVPYLKLLSSSMELEYREDAKVGIFKIGNKDFKAIRKWFLNKGFLVPRLARKIKGLL